MDKIIKMQRTTNRMIELMREREMQRTTNDVVIKIMQTQV